jgi:enoyl-CoA hydratase/carnithine racemase
MAGVVGTGTAELGIDDRAFAAGHDVEALANEALHALPEPKAVRQLARLVRDHSEIVQRMPLFHDRMDHLLRTGGDAVLRRVFSEVRQGRPLGMPYMVVGLVEQVGAAEGCSVAQAAKIVAAKLGSEFNITPERIRNMHSEFRHEYTLFRTSKYVPGERLTRRRWSR